MEMQLFPDLSPIRNKQLNQICLSFDLETPNKYDDGIFSIGITPFSFETGEVFEECSFYVRMDFAEVIELSRNIGDTMKWWMQQSDAARFELISKTLPKEADGRKIVNDIPCCGYEEALEHSLTYIMQVKASLLTNGTVWVMGNGAIFDIGKYEDTLRTFKLIGGIGAKYDDDKFQDLCYKFWNIVDLRSYLHLASMVSGKNVKKMVTRKGVHHNAIDDAAHQARLALKAKEVLEEGYGKA